MIAGRLASVRESGAVRALVYLDLALEQLLRLSIERQLQTPPAAEQIASLIALALQNVRLSSPDEQLRMCQKQWERLQSVSRGDRLWALRADAASERIAREVAALLDRYQQALQGKAEMLGRAVHADAWAIASFSEEVIRGRAAVVLPVLTRLLRRDLRRDHRLPSWQIVSPGHASGELRVVDSLESIQGTRFARPAVILAGRVGGQEEIPVGVSAVVTAQDVDILSHVGIRARNAGVLFAACHDSDEIDRLKALAGQQMTLLVTASGDVSVQRGHAQASFDAEAGHGEPGERQVEAVNQRARAKETGEARTGAARRPVHYVVTPGDFTEAAVGGKARNLVRLEGKLPPWIHLPQSFAIPFGAFDRVLHDAGNAETARRYRDLVVRLEGVRTGDAGQRKEVLGVLRQTIASLIAPPELLGTVRAAFDQAQLAWPDPERVWSCIKQVWASKWNERAFLSREANGIDHEGVAMSVLIQAVIEADYAFVIHTANPSTGARDEIHGEVVRGLGETLVGSYPGRALSFTRNRDATIDLLAFPSKSTGLFGGGVIFRSDSNAEDLAGYAGAGLYDSVMLAPPRTVLLDYSEEPLVWDDESRRHVVSKIAEIGIAVERSLGSPQDIEGACVKDEWYVLQSRPQIGLRGA
jgi:alpha-glucan,water dikinase